MFYTLYYTLFYIILYLYSTLVYTILDYSIAQMKYNKNSFNSHPFQYNDIVSAQKAKYPIIASKIRDHRTRMKSR